MPKKPIREFVKQMTDRHGRKRFYFVREGMRATLPGKPGSQEFEAAYANCRGGAPPAAKAPLDRASPGTFSDLCRRYFLSAAYIALGPVTKRTYKNAIERLRREHGEKPIAMLDRRGVKAIVAKHASKPGAANQALRMLRMLLNFAVDEGDRESNPSLNIPKLKTKTGGFKAWSDEWIEAFETHHKPGSKPRLALNLLLCTAQRRGDVVRLGHGNIRRGRMRLTQSKTGAELDIPIHRTLAAEIARSPVSAPTFLLTAYGKPFTPAGFGNWFRDQCSAAGLPGGYNAHGLRKAALRRLAEAGCTVHEIMAISGHKTLAEVERYTKAANMVGLAGAAMEKLEGRRGLPEGLPETQLSYCAHSILALPTAICIPSNDNRLGEGLPEKMPVGVR